MLDCDGLRRFRGRHSFGEPHTTILTQKSPVAEKPGAIDYRQLEEQIKCVPETEPLLYGGYTPTAVEYVPGGRPVLDVIAHGATRGERGEDGRVAAIMRWIHSRMTHPAYACPPAGLTEEEMILNACAPSCNLCSRILCMLTQVVGIPSRMVFLYSSFVNSWGGCQHTVAEALVGGRWGVVDPRAGRQYRLDDGRIASALEIQRDPDLVTRTLSPEERRDALENGGILDVRMFHQFAVCNYLISDPRPARESDDVLPEEWRRRTRGALPPL